MEKVSSEQEAKQQAQMEAQARKFSTTIGLSTIGSAAGLIYGIKEQKRWWIVILLMLGGGALGRGVGFMIDENKTTQSNG